jgi:hypothetical protein
MAAPNDTASMALFCDFENIALGVRDAQYEKFDIRPVLERLLAKAASSSRRPIATGIATRVSRRPCTKPISS